jgi:hypothetical protein
VRCQKYWGIRQGLVSNRRWLALSAVTVAFLSIALHRWPLTDAQVADSSPPVTTQPAATSNPPFDCPPGIPVVLTHGLVNPLGHGQDAPASALHDYLARNHPLLDGGFQPRPAVSAEPGVNAAAGGPPVDFGLVDRGVIRATAEVTQLRDGSWTVLTIAGCEHLFRTK